MQEFQSWELNVQGNDIWEERHKGKGGGVVLLKTVVICAVTRNNFGSIYSYIELKSV